MITAAARHTCTATFHNRRRARRGDMPINETTLTNVRAGNDITALSGNNRAMLADRGFGVQDVLRLSEGDHQKAPFIFIEDAGQDLQA